VSTVNWQVLMRTWTCSLSQDAYSPRVLCVLVWLIGVSILRRFYRVLLQLCSSLFLQDHSNVGAVSLLYLVPEGRRLQHEMVGQGDETEGRRLKHDVDYYTHLLSNPEAMEEFHARARKSYKNNQRVGGRALETGDECDLQGEIVRQNVTFVDCLFEGNTYGERNEATNYGAIGVETADNDCVVTNSTFTGNMFGDAAIVVSMIGFIRL